MKKIIGLLIILVGIGFGIWLGLYVMLYGGIVQIISNINPINASGLALGVIRAILFEIGFIPTYVGVIIGMTMISL